MRRQHGRAALTAGAILTLAACTSGAVGQYPIDAVNPVTASKLQFSVGWVTTYAPLEANALSYGLNFVETFRQSNGRSAVQSDTAEILFPKPLNVHLISLDEPYNLTLVPPLAALGAGINSGATATSGGLATTDFNPDIGTGGPPAFPAPADSTSFTKVFSEGYYADFPDVPANQSTYIGDPLTEAEQYFPGSYKLQVTIPTGQTSTVLTSASATLTGVPLPYIAQPSVAPDGTGGALVTVTIPAGVTETVVSISTNACSPPPVVAVQQLYTLISHVAGPGTDRLTLPDFIAPSGSLVPYHAICSQVEFQRAFNSTAYVAGFDYPVFESVYPQSFSQAPLITGAGGRSDMTLSAPLTFTTP